ncbi:MAG: AEC family transporter [Desulfobacterales bacterium]|nr:AEC family transporter [Desulfobacterales bacterium]
MFIQTGTIVFNAIFQLFLIAFAAGLLIRRNMISGEQVKALSFVTVNIFLPCLIIAKTLIRFHPEELSVWWVLPVSGVVIVLTGLFFSAILFRFKPEKKHFMALASMQNGIYIVLPIGQILFPDQFDLFALYCFLLVMGLNPMMWSVGKVMLSGDKESGFRLKDIMTPPLAAIFISVGAVFFKLTLIIPAPVISAMDLLGQATVPLAVFILGATIGSISLKDLPEFTDIAIVSIVKFLLVPASVFSMLYFGEFNLSIPLICSMLMIQASSPPATNLILIVENYGGDTRSVSSMMLIQNIVAILMMPLWIAAWQLIG